MSRFSGKQYKGAKRNAKDIRRDEAEKRNRSYQYAMDYIGKMSPTDRLLCVIMGDRPWENPPQPILQTPAMDSGSKWFREIGESSKSN